MRTFNEILHECKIKLFGEILREAKLREAYVKPSRAVRLFSNLRDAGIPEQTLTLLRRSFSDTFGDLSGPVPDFEPNPEAE